jgi:hypothetical protein
MANPFYAAFSSPYLQAYAAAPPGGAGAVMGWPIAPPAPVATPAGNAAALLGLEWALEEADFASARIATPRAPGGLPFAFAPPYAGGAAAAGLPPSGAGWDGAPAGAPRMRCLDPSHVAPCSRCVVAPARGAAGRCPCLPP